MSKEEALEQAKQYGLEWEVQEAMNNGCTPEQALSEWDIA